ncbi:MAG: hypothetical protein ACRED5_16105 [Propylenella sp.]
MIEGRRALDLALDLARMPTLGEAMRTHPLPPDTLVVIRIAAGCSETSREAVRATGLSATAIRDACVFYLEHVLLASDADSHRILGVRPGAPRSEMREHMRWLLKWLHPDGNRNEWESVFAGRVLKAWREAGAKKQANSPGRNGAGASRNSAAAPSRSQPPNRWIAVPLNSATGRGRLRLARWFRSLSPFSRTR